MRRTTEDQPRGIRWTLFLTLEVLDFADDLALVSHTHQNMQEKTSRVSTFAQQEGLKFRQKTDVMMLNVQHPALVKVNRENLTTIQELTYLGSTLRHGGGAGSDIKNESPQQGQKRLKNDGHRRLEVIPVQHQDQTKTVQELCAFHPTERLGMLEDDEL